MGTSSTSAALYLQIEEIRQRQERESRQEQDLQSKIRNGELMCGRLLQQYLEIGHALDLKRKHVREDRQQLSEIQQQWERTAEELETATHQISRIVLNTSYSDIRMVE